MLKTKNKNCQIIYNILPNISSTWTVRKLQYPNGFIFKTLHSRCGRPARIVHHARFYFTWPSMRWLRRFCPRVRERFLIYFVVLKLKIATFRAHLVASIQFNSNFKRIRVLCIYCTYTTLRLLFFFFVRQLPDVLFNRAALINYQEKSWFHTPRISLKDASSR